MEKGEKSMLLLGIVTAFIVTVLLLPGLARAGSLDPPGPPTTAGTMRTLDEIYNKLDQLVPGVSGLAPVEKTGQTKCYDTSGVLIDCLDTGQDGEIQAGVLWPAPRFTDNADGTVTDNLTGIIWLKDADCFGRRIWTDALSEANGLASGSCGLTDGSNAGDWHLPNVKELQSLIDYGQYNSALPPGYGSIFNDVQSHEYWSSTTYEDDTVCAWGVGIRNGSVKYGSKESYALYVWPVRADN
jgi:hypothetical protein